MSESGSGGDGRRAMDGVERERAEVEAAVASAAEQVEQAVRKADREVARREHALARAERARSELKSYRDALIAIRSSRGYRVLLAYYRAVERLAPRGTRRREVYGRIVRSVVQVSSSALNRLPHAPEHITLPTTDGVPLVSVVIPVHGKWQVTAQCLRSFVDAPPTVPFEVVIVDDASPDDTRHRLASVVGAKVVALDVNLGFVGAVNAGISACRGEYVALLNNDTQIGDGWLEALLSAAAEPAVGLVGSKLVYPDGRLQEAGGIMFDDATGWNYGRFDDPDKLRYNVRRDVDYCSGAAILIRRELLNELGGLDEYFAPAYYDDTDLAFAVRERGLRVVYEPRAVVIHHEGVSHGTDETSGIKRFQAINRLKMVDKWSNRLAAHFPQDPAFVEAGARRHGPGTIVFIDDHVPQPDEDSGSVRTFAFLRTLRKLGFATVFVPDNRNCDEAWTQRLLDEGVEVFLGPESTESFLRSIAPVTRAVIGARVTVAWPYLGMVRRVMPGVPFIFDTVDLHHLRERRQAELSEDTALARRAEETRALEVAMVTAADATIVVSPVEVDVLAEEAPDAVVRVVPNVHERRAEGRGPGGRSGLLFVGSFAHPPNGDAMRWFISDVLPLVALEVPGVVLRVVGRGVPDDILELAARRPDVEVMGWLPSLDDVYERTRVVVAPLRYGAGVKGKVGEALSHGVPVVGTTIAMEGMHIEHGVTGWTADTPAEIAAGIVRLIEDDDLWSAVSIAGREHVHEVLGEDRFEALVVDALASVDVKVGDRARPVS